MLTLPFSQIIFGLSYFPSREEPRSSGDSSSIGTHFRIWGVGTKEILNERRPPRPNLTKAEQTTAVVCSAGTNYYTSCPLPPAAAYCTAGAPTAAARAPPPIITRWRQRVGSRTPAAGGTRAFGSRHLGIPPVGCARYPPPTFPVGAWISTLRPGKGVGGRG